MAVAVLVRALCVVLCLSIAAGSRTPRQLLQTGREARNTDAAAITSATIGQAVAAASKPEAMQKPRPQPTKTPSGPPVKSVVVSTTSQGSTLKVPVNAAPQRPTFTAGAAAQVGAGAAGHVNHPVDGTPTVGKKATGTPLANAGH